MLRFMISGYIPGTERQISFYEFIIVISIATSLYLTWLLFKESRSLQQHIIENALNKNV